MQMKQTIESNLFIDKQAQKPAGRCQVCGGELYDPHGTCLRCSREGFQELSRLSEGYRQAALPIRARLRELRQALAAAEDPEDIWHIKRRIAELTPMLTQMNELAELTARYYERGYWRSEKYTL
jgi:hypothetical protein